MAIARINLKTGLPKARAIFDQLTPGKCEYAAPCVLGAMVPENKRDDLDCANVDDTSIETLLRDGSVVAPKYQHDDLIRLQQAFDRKEAFAEVFAEVEAKYAPQVLA